ncbi:MAG: hypothetical protein BM556_08365 [Bacteriovorax sp. MedPE-SWde]|nr:MAG: hypothetical protein BM556_08365 [Bacteriovorax sp. MedPE-SWde]
MAALSLLADILRIITPEEISELTASSSGSNRLELTDMLDQFESGEKLNFSDDEEGAKILPFKKTEADEVESVEPVSTGAAVIEYINHFNEKSRMGDTARGKTGEAVETSVFILKEKERFKYVQSKLKQREVMGLYLKNAGVDIEQEKTLKEDMSKSSRSGVLVNKKQF